MQLIPINSTFILEQDASDKKVIISDVLGRKSKINKNSIQIIKTKNGTLTKQIKIQ